LSFLGLGDPGAVSWGQLLVSAEGGAFTSRLWAWVLAPGFAIFVAVIGFMRIGSAMEEIYNPRLRSARALNRPSARATAAGGAAVEAALASMRELTPEEVEEALTLM